ncbi:14-3-3-like protein [Branchiostoma lanceolatum]|uniref:14-3-3-like protein n=1 Tax=Branchiostoma lanceolatum TaxID=7740 RepID=UPI003452C80A
MSADETPTAVGPVKMRDKALSTVEDVREAPVRSKKTSGDAIDGGDTKEVLDDAVNERGERSSTVRYDDMVKYMKELTRMDQKLTKDQRNLLSVAFKNVVGARRSAWRIPSSLQQQRADKGLEESDSGQAAKCQREKVETEMKAMCCDVLELLDKFLIPEVDDVEAEVFYHKLKEDYFCYLTEILEGSEREDMAAKSRESYEKALEKAAGLPTTNPVRLGLALNLSVFHYEIRNDGKEACRVANDAFNAAMSEADNLKDDSYKDSTLIMQLLRDNLTLWTSETEDHEDPGEN